jgi:PAS domain S-box-containing protein
VSLVARIFALIAFTLVLVASGEVINGVNLRQNRLAEVRGDTMQLARIAELDMGRTLEGSRQLLATLAKLPIQHGWDARACAIIEATASSDFEYDHIVAVDHSGTISCTSSGIATAGTKSADLELVNRIVATASFSVGTHGIGRISGNEVIRVGYPVVDDAGTVTGAVYAGINVTWLNTAINQWKLGENVSIQITDRNGILVASHPDPRTVGHPISDDLKPFVFKVAPGATEVKDAGGAIRVYGYAPIDNDDVWDGFAVFVGRDQGPILADIDRSIWLNVAWVLTALLASAIIAVIYVRQFLTRPFRRLLTVAGRWRDGDWSVRTGAPSGIPEFDRLLQAFDGMAAEVSARDRSLRQERDFTTALINSLPGLFALIDESGRLIRWNKNVSVRTGIPDSTLQGFEAISLVAETERDLMRAKMSEGFTKGALDFDCRTLAKEGGTRTIHFGGQKIANDGHPYLLLVGTDVTDRNRIEEKINRLARPRSADRPCQPRRFRRGAGCRNCPGAPHREKLGGTLHGPRSFQGRQRYPRPSRWRPVVAIGGCAASRDRA